MPQVDHSHPPHQAARVVRIRVWPADLRHSSPTDNIKGVVGAVDVAGPGWPSAKEPDRHGVLVNEKSIRRPTRRATLGSPSTLAAGPASCWAGLPSMELALPAPDADDDEPPSS